MNPTSASAGGGCRSLAPGHRDPPAIGAQVRSGNRWAAPDSIAAGATRGGDGQAATHARRTWHGLQMAWPRPYPAWTLAPEQGGRAKPDSFSGGVTWGDAVENRKSCQRNWHGLQWFSLGPSQVTAADLPSGPVRGWTVFCQIDFPGAGGVSDSIENTPTLRKVFLGGGQL